MATQNAARPLRDAVQRLARAPQARALGWMALALHLSRLAPPAPRPHHRRIARAVLDDAASRHEGHLFPLDNGDLVLLWPASDSGAGLASTLARLFKIDAPNADLLLTRWLLPSDIEALLAYVDLAEAEARPPPPPPPEPSLPVTGIEAIAALIDSSPITDLLQRQTAVLLTEASPSGLRPAFREVTFSFAILEARVAASGHAAADPFLFRHLAHRVDGRMLHALAEDLRHGGRLLAWVRDGGPMLHLNLTLAGILSPGFAGFASACREAGARVSIEVSLLDACADAETFLLARERLRLAGLGFVLDAVSHHALLITIPAALQPDLVKLDWSRQVPEAGLAIETAIDALGPERVVLRRADTEEAMRWGLARGIRLFQGRHVDAMLAASRIAGCAYSGLCTLRQCMERESATSDAGRAGCRNLALLDEAAPREPAPR